MMPDLAVKWNLSNFWPTKGFIGVFISLVATFVLIPLFNEGFYAHLLLQFCFTALILSILYTLSQQKKVLAAGAFLIVFSLIFDGLGLMRSSSTFVIIAYCGYCLYLGMAIFFLSIRVIAASLISTNLMFAAFTIYWLAGILWSRLYFLINIAIPHSFHGISEIKPENMFENGYGVQFDLLYFSLTTLTCLGVGDIVPIHRFAKSMMILEAVFGQLFVATFIAKVVSVWHRRS
ncbi:two pore domain potassium channel family protein [Candidatus Protochlamydia phocaeensis]|uniref:two pore domain potassium channel family protein n=1 Tax=Candidatus Protochlamydia phocaeensis TaxID=1414722 RepID=UPI000A9DB1F4|nr:two pore domain potassium channel family protein [Candidatus Protochlamydia phocaeensis]